MRSVTSLILASALVNLFTLNLSRADSCDKPVDLRKSTAKELPSGEQGDTYTCGYFAASTLLDSFRLRTLGKLDSKPIDPLALAVDLAVAKNRPRWLPFQLTSDPFSEVNGKRGSYFCDIIQHARENGVCDHNDARSLDRDWMHFRSNQNLVLYRLLGPFADLEEEEQKSGLKVLTAEVRKVINNEPGIPPNDDALGAILWESRNYPYRTIRSLLYSQCKNNRAGKVLEELPSCYTEWFLKPIGKAGNISDSIHNGLDDPKSLPIPVLHCYQVLREGRSYNGSNPASESCILHYTSVMGRRKKNGVCQYLIRNSYDPTDEYAVSKDWERDQSDLWVDEKHFTRSAYALHWLD